MKKITIGLLFLLATAHLNVAAQGTTTTTTATITTTTNTRTGGEKHGNTLNLGLGAGGYAGYYGYVGRVMPVMNVNYEFDVARNFTLAPSISFYTYGNSYYWGNGNNPYRYYTYRETVIPIGAKATYYFDQLFHANPHWDFYAAGSAGFAIVSSHWETGYDGNPNYYHHANPIFLDLHIGTEYHINNKVGIFLDLSTGVSTIGLAIH